MPCVMNRAVVGRREAARQRGVLPAATVQDFAQALPTAQITTFDVPLDAPLSRSRVAPMRRAPAAQAGQPAPEVDEGLLPHAVHLQPTTPLDGTLPVGRGRHPPIRPPLFQPPAASFTAGCTLYNPQGVAFKAPPLLAWHPAADRLLTASTAALVEYDAVSGARRNLVEPGGLPLRVRYTPSGGAVVLLTRVRRDERRRAAGGAAAAAAAGPTVCCRPPGQLPARCSFPFATCMLLPNRSGAGHLCMEHQQLEAAGAAGSRP